MHSAEGEQARPKANLTNTCSTWHNMIRVIRVQIIFPLSEHIRVIDLRSSLLSLGIIGTSSILLSLTRSLREIRVPFLTVELKIRVNS